MNFLTAANLSPEASRLLETATTPVVEHKGIVERAGVFFALTGAVPVTFAVCQSRPRVRRLFDATSLVRKNPNYFDPAVRKCLSSPLICRGFGLCKNTQARPGTPGSRSGFPEKINIRSSRQRKREATQTPARSSGRQSGTN